MHGYTINTGKNTCLTFVLLIALVFPYTAEASLFAQVTDRSSLFLTSTGEVASRFLCGVKLLFGGSCASMSTMEENPARPPASLPPEGASKSSQESGAQLPPPQEEGVTSPAITHVTNHYNTFPTNIVREIVRTGGGSGGGNYVSQALFNAQVDAFYDSLSNNNQGLSESFGTETLSVSGETTLSGPLTAATSTLSTLTVSGDASVGGALSIMGNTTIDGVLTAGSLSVAGVSSGGAISAPYFTATSTTATSTFAGGLRVFGDIRTDAGSETNTFLGVDAGAANDAAGGGLNNTFIGNLAGQSNTTGKDNTVIGWRNFIDNTTGTDNVAIGMNTLLRNTEGRDNIGIGTNVGRDNATGTSNIAIGYSSMRENEGGSRNVAIGEFALEGLNNNSRPNNTIAVGYAAARDVTDGENNTVVGPESGLNIRSGSNNILIGYQADVPTDSTSNYLNLGNALFGDLGTGNIGIGTTTPSEELTVAGTIQATNLLGGAVNLTTDVNGNIIRDPSDRRLKENIAEIDGALDTLLQLRGVSYEWIDKERFGEQVEIGFIAQEVDPLLPEVVRKGGEYWSLNTRNMLAVVVEGFQEFHVSFETLQETVAGFAKRVVSDEIVANNQICIGETCFDEEGLKELLEEEGIEVSPPTSSDGGSTGDHASSGADSGGGSESSDEKSTFEEADQSEASATTTPGVGDHGNEVASSTPAAEDGGDLPPSSNNSAQANADVENIETENDTDEQPEQTEPKSNPEPAVEEDSDSSDESEGFESSESESDPALEPAPAETATE